MTSKWSSCSLPQGAPYLVRLVVLFMCLSAICFSFSFFLFLVLLLPSLPSRHFLLVLYILPGNPDLTREVNRHLQPLLLLFAKSYTNTSLPRNEVNQTVMRHSLQSVENPRPVLFASFRLQPVENSWTFTVRTFRPSTPYVPPGWSKNVISTLHRNQRQPHASVDHSLLSPTGGESSNFCR